MADVLGVPVHVPVVEESTALGAAIYAGVGAGLYGSSPTWAPARASSAPSSPTPSAHDAYDELFARWREVYRHSLEMVDAEGDPTIVEARRRMTAADVHAMGRRALAEIGAVIDRIPAGDIEPPLQRDPRRKAHRLLRRRARGVDGSALCMRLMHLGSTRTSSAT